MANTPLIKSFKRDVKYEWPVLVVFDIDEETRDPVQIKWNLEQKFQTHMSTLYLATNERHETKMIKRIPKLSVRELDALIQLSGSGHKHFFVGLHLWFEHANEIYCMMDYFSLGDLGTFRRNFDPPEDWLQTITFQLLQGLKAMHEFGYAHRDIKPSNILMARENPPQIRICDFGISKRVANDDTSFINTAIGTPSYVAPEVLHRDTSVRNDRVDIKIDIWAVGCVLVELITGRVLFPQVQDTGIFCMSMDTQSQLWTELSRKVQPDGVKLISQFLKVDPNQRPTAEDALLEDWVKNRPTLLRARDREQVAHAQPISRSGDGSFLLQADAPLRRDLEPSRREPSPLLSLPVRDSEVLGTSFVDNSSRPHEGVEAIPVAEEAYPELMTLNIVRPEMADSFTAIMSPFDLVGTLKTTILDQKGIPLEEQRLESQGMELRIDKTLHELGITHLSTIVLSTPQDATPAKRMSITIRALNGESTVASIAPSDTIRKLQEVTLARFGFPFARQRFMFAGKLLSDLDKTLEDYRIKDGNTILLVVKKE